MAAVSRWCQRRREPEPHDLVAMHKKDRGGTAHFMVPVLDPSSGAPGAIPAAAKGHTAPWWRPMLWPLLACLFWYAWLAWRVHVGYPPLWPVTRFNHTTENQTNSTSWKCPEEPAIPPMTSIEAMFAQCEAGACPPIGSLEPGDAPWLAYLNGIHQSDER